MKTTFYAFMFAAILSAGTSVAARGGMVDYRAQGTDVRPGTTFSIGGVTAVGSGALDVQAYGGLGVLGGYVMGNGADLIDGSESVRFSFDAGPATGVSLLYVFASGPTASFVGDFQGFDASGRSLGVHHLYLNAAPPNVPIDVSSFFGGAALSAFSFTGGGSAAGLSVGSITFAAAVPEPSSLLTLALGGLGLAACLRRPSAGR